MSAPAQHQSLKAIEKVLRDRPRGTTRCVDICIASLDLPNASAAILEWANDNDFAIVEDHPDVGVVRVLSFGD